MKVHLAMVSPRRAGLSGPPDELVRLYLSRATRYIPCEISRFASEAKLLAFVDEMTARTRPALLLADSRGQQLSSPELASLIGGFQDAGTQSLVLAIGPADGWSEAAYNRAATGRARAIAFGRITLPHELAAVVAAEQIYRALTIRAGHPYHSGHE